MTEKYCMCTDLSNSIDDFGYVVRRGEIMPIPEIHESNSKFPDIIREIQELHDKKSADYGSKEDRLANVRDSESFGIPAWVGVMIRANDKIVRIKSLIKNGKLVNESVEDSLLDLATYSIIALQLYRESNVKG